MFFFPSAVSVERQVLQGSLLGGAVRQSKFGIEDDVPVPRKMSSVSRLVLLSVVNLDGEGGSSSALEIFPLAWVVKVSTKVEIMSSVDFKSLTKLSGPSF